MSHTQSDESPDEEAVFSFLIDSLHDRGQTRFCKNLLVNLFEPGISPCKAKFPDVKVKRQIIEHYLKDICNLTQQYGEIVQTTVTTTQQSISFTNTPQSDNTKKSEYITNTGNLTVNR